MPPAVFTILVVDDSLTQLAVLEDALQGAGYRVETAQDGMEAIAKVYHSPPSLILSDVMMPELNGYHLCRLLKNDPGTAHIPIILLTNLKERHDRFWGEKAGANLYIGKESDLTPIVEAVESLLAQTASPQASPLPSPPELSSTDIRTRVTGILDQLLYESTISNEVLKLTGLAHDVDHLAREFLRFLSVICRYNVACLLLNDGRDKHVLCIQTIEAVGAEQIEKAKQQTLEAAGLTLRQQCPVRILHLHEEAEKPCEAGQLHLLQTLPILDQDERLATLTLFSARKERISEGTRHALNVVAERLLIVTRYLKKFKEIEEVKSDFVSMLVHDMRSPLTSIRGFTDVLAEGVLGTVSEEQASALETIQGSCDQLLMLIEDVLDLSKLEAGKMQIHPGPLSIRALAERTCNSLSVLLKEKNLTLAFDIPEDCPWVLADGKQLPRVMTNLLTNAVKFTPPGGVITISAQPPPGQEAKPSHRLQISVADTGPGIPAEQQQKLFAHYQQLPAVRTFSKGTGLGLAICKEIILLHQGAIWVESPLNADGGSRFSFTLPTDE
jgi:signal transduction histidine kinase/CheY-like chemotaxis protein